LLHDSWHDARGVREISAPFAGSLVRVIALRSFEGLSIQNLILTKFGVEVHRPCGKDSLPRIEWVVSK